MPVLLPDFDPETGCLPAPPQFHDATTGDVKDAFVDAFQGSEKRPKISAAYMNHIEKWTPLVGKEPREQWMDGSFVTNKPEPNDVDFVTFIPVEALNRLSRRHRETMRELFAGPKQQPGQLCHAFVVTVAPPGTPQARVTEHQRRYWERWFGRQRPEQGGHRKGIVRLEVGGPS